MNKACDKEPSKVVARMDVAPSGQNPVLLFVSMAHSCWRSNALAQAPATLLLHRTTKHIGKQVTTDLHRTTKYIDKQVKTDLHRTAKHTGKQVTTDLHRTTKHIGKQVTTDLHRITKYIGKQVKTDCTRASSHAYGNGFCVFW